ncbi:hypothetical protein HK405_009829, partial [Cladochytrium tenue]
MAAAGDGATSSDLHVAVATNTASAVASEENKSPVNENTSSVLAECDTTTRQPAALFDSDSELSSVESTSSSENVASKRPPVASHKRKRNGEVHAAQARETPEARKKPAGKRKPRAADLQNRASRDNPRSPLTNGYAPRKPAKKKHRRGDAASAGVVIPANLFNPFRISSLISPSNYSSAHHTHSAGYAADLLRPSASSTARDSGPRSLPPNQSPSVCTRPAFSPAPAAESSRSTRCGSPPPLEPSVLAALTTARLSGASQAEIDYLLGYCRGIAEDMAEIRAAAAPLEPPSPPALASAPTSTAATANNSSNVGSSPTGEGTLSPPRGQRNGFGSRILRPLQNAPTYTSFFTDGVHQDVGTMSPPKWSAEDEKQKESNKGVLQPPKTFQQLGIQKEPRVEYTGRNGFANKSSSLFDKNHMVSRGSGSADLRTVFEDLQNTLAEMNPRVFQLPYEVWGPFAHVIPHPGTGDYVDTTEFEVTVGSEPSGGKPLRGSLRPASGGSKRRPDVRLTSPNAHQFLDPPRLRPHIPKPTCVTGTVADWALDPVVQLLSE